MKLAPDELAKLAYVIASQYVESPDRLRVMGERRGETLIVTFPGRHLKADHGHLIGHQGKHYRALQRILEYAADEPVRLNIVDPGGERMDSTPIPPNLSTDKDESFRAVLEVVAEDVFDYPVPVRVRSMNQTATFTLEVGEIDPELLSAFQVLWKAIGRHHGRNFILNAEAPKEQAV